MSNRIELGRLLGRTITVAGLVIGSTVVTTAAFAGSCPADKMKADAREPVKFAPVGVTDTTLGAIDLAKEPAKLKDRQLRFRKLTIEPNGIVPWHSHSDRPALIFIAEGEIIEYASNCAALTGPPGVAYVEAEKRELEAAARALGVRLVVVRASTANDIAPAFATLVEQQADALLIWPSGVLNAAPDQIIALAARHAIPAMFFYSYAVSNGGFASYGPDVNELWHWAGAYTGRILKGEKPADLPVTRPTKFELVINMKTAKALSLTIPETLLATADRVIE